MTIDGILEISNSGVIYFHSKQTGTTVLRIQGTGIPADLAQRITDEKVGLQFDLDLTDETVAPESQKTWSLSLPQSFGRLP